MRGEPDVVDVELIEVDADGSSIDGIDQPDQVGGTSLHDSVDDTPSPEAQELARADGRRRTRRRLVFGVAASLPVIAFIAIGLVVEARQEATRLATLADSPGVLAPVTGPLTETWRVENGIHSGEVGGLLLVGVSSVGQVRAVDPATGEVRWVHEFPSSWGGDAPSYCAPLLGYTDDLATLHGQRSALADASMLTCLQEPSMPREPDRSGAVEVLDAATGVVHFTFPIDGGLLFSGLVDADLVTVVGDTDGYVSWTRRDLPRGDVVWSFRSEHPVLGEEGSRLRSTMPDGDTLRIEGAATLVLALDSGESVVSDEPADRADVDLTGFTATMPLPDGGTAVWEHSLDAQNRGHGHVQDEDGSVRFELPGPVLRPQVDDGSWPDLLLVEPLGTRGIQALDAATGHVVWGNEELYGYPMVQVDGLLVVTGGLGVQVVDVRDGSLRWEATADPVLGGSALTDGSTLLVARVEAGAPVLVALRLTDGTEQWHVPLPAGTQYLTSTLAGRVLVMTEDALVGLG